MCVFILTLYPLPKTRIIDYCQEVRHQCLHKIVCVCCGMNEYACLLALHSGPHYQGLSYSRYIHARLVAPSLSLMDPQHLPFFEPIFPSSIIAGVLVAFD